MVTSGYEWLQGVKGSCGWFWVVTSFHRLLRVVMGGFGMVTDGHGVEMGGQG